MPKTRQPTDITISLPGLHADLRRIIADASEARFVVLAAGRRYSKSTLALHLMAAALEGKHVGYFTPTYKYLGAMWRWCLTTYHPLIASHNATAGLIETRTGGTMEFWTMTNPDAGRSRKYHRVILDEAGLMRSGTLMPLWSQAIRPTLADYQGGAWLLGSPRGFNDFYELYQRGQVGTAEHIEGWRSYQRPTAANPHIAPEEIATMRAELPELVAAQELDAQFVALTAGEFPTTWPMANAGDPTPVLARVRFWDLAGAEKDGGDYTVGARLALLADRRVRVEHVIRFQEKRHNRNEKMRAVASEDARLGLVTQVIEAPPGLGRDASSGAALALNGYVVEEVPPRGNKVVRADAYISAAQGGRVELLAGPWVREFINEHIAFPWGAHDDQVDAANGAFTWLHSHHAAAANVASYDRRVAGRR